MILCVGTSPAVQRVMIFDRLLADQPNLAVETLQCAAGKATNVARALRRLGEAPLLLTFAGGLTGDYIIEEMEREGIACRRIAVRDATRICTTVVDRSSGTATELVEKHAPVEQAAWEKLRQEFESALSDAAMVALSGSLPPGADEGFYGWCIAAANAAGIRTVIDARTGPLIRALPRRPFLVKSNRAELAQTTGSSDLRAGLLHLINAGASWAIATLGGDGAVLADGNRFWRLNVPKITPVSAVGSGDAFTAGLTAELARGKDVPEACILAAACGISNALDPLPAHIHPEQLDGLRAAIQVEQC